MAAAATGVLVAIVAGLFGLGGATIAARRDHHRWLLQARLEAYAAFLAAATETTISFVLRDSQVTKDRQHPADTNDAQFRALDRMEETAARVLLLGPKEVTDLCGPLYSYVSKVALHGNNDARPEYHEIRDAFITAARRSLSR